MLNEDFVKKYAALNKSHANGHYIWQLCELSFCAAGIGHGGSGNVRQLADACLPKLDTDTIYLRRDAWIGYQVFLKVPEELLVDDDGLQAEDHEGVRQMLTYSHFALVGKRFRQRLLRDRDELALLLVAWAKEGKSVREASEELTQIVGRFVSVRDDVRRLRSAAAKVLGHGDNIPLRLYRYAAVIARRDWLE